MAKKNFLFSQSLLNRLPVLRQPSWMIEGALFNGMIGFLRLWSPERGFKIARAIMRNTYWAFPFAKKIQGNVSIAFPDLSERQTKRLTKQICGNLGGVIADLVYGKQIWDERNKRIEFIYKSEGGKDSFLEKYHNKPVVMVTGHIGPWQITPFVGPCHDIDVTSIFAPEENPYIRKTMVELRDALQGAFINRNGCMRHLLSALKHHEAVGLVCDGRTEGGEPINFFDTPTYANSIAPRLAVKEGCDLLPIRAERLADMRFRITLGPAITPEDTCSTASEKVSDMTRQMMNCFESWIKEKPEEWMCFSRRWPRENYPD